MLLFPTTPALLKNLIPLLVTLRRTSYRERTPLAVDVS